MTGMDMLLASLTQEQLVERAHADVVETQAELQQAIAEFEADLFRFLIEDLEKRTRE
jgi:hypothetical protein